MAKPLTFDEACETWRNLMASDDESAAMGPLLEACEILILDYPVGSHTQAAAICEVLAAGVDGGRSDGRDLGALKRLSRWLSMIAGAGTLPVGARPHAA